MLLNILMGFVCGWIGIDFAKSQAPDEEIPSWKTIAKGAIYGMGLSILVTILIAIAVSFFKGSPE